MTTDRAMRASDQDREHVVELLRTQYAEGRLTLEEFDERMASAYGGKTWGDLTDLVSDLPVDPRFAAPRANLARAPDLPPAPHRPHRPQGPRPPVPRWLWPLVPALIAVTVLAAMPWGVGDGRHHHHVSVFPIWLLIIVFIILRRAALRRRGRRGPFL